MTIINATNSDDSTDASNSDSSPVTPASTEAFETLFRTTGTYIAPPTNPWGSDPFGPDIPTPVEDAVVKSDEEKKVEDTPKLTPEQIAEAKKKHFAEKRSLQKSYLTIKRTVLLQDITITKDDMLVGLSPSFKVYHTDLEDGIKMRDVINVGDKTSIRRRRSQTQGSISNLFVFDKNFNYLVVNNHRTNELKMRRDHIRISSNEAYNENYKLEESMVSFIILDKKKFLESDGKVWKIKYRSEITYKDILQIKRRFVEKFAAMRTIVPRLRTIMGRLYPEDNFDLRYILNATNENANYFTILVRHENITIRNSIELERHIGEMMIRTTGIHKYRSDREFPIGLLGDILGNRMSFTASDAAVNYQHSHLTTTMHSLQNFCTGGEAYNTSALYCEETDLEQLMFRIEEFLAWESLEGGPHFRIEDISIHGPLFSFARGAMRNDRSVSERYIRYIISEIQRKGSFDKLRNCFQLTIDRGTLKYILDQNMFFEKFIGLFSNEEVRSIHNAFHEDLYTFNSMNKNFNYVNDMPMTKADNIVKRASDNIQHIRPVHINGKYYRPHLTERTGKDLLEGLLFSFDPNFMLEVANFILYQLTTDLETYGKN
jgi:hypothetical protein